MDNNYIHLLSNLQDQGGDKGVPVGTCVRVGGVIFLIKSVLISGAE